MKLLTVYGASDDLIESDGIDGADEFNAINGGVLKVWSPSSGESFRIFCRNESGACWSISPCQSSDDKPLPDWPMRIVQSPACRYSVQLEVECPDDAKVVFCGTVR